MDPAEVQTLVDGLRHGGGDTSAIEVKAAAGGFPRSLTESLSALANLPGGGVVILGLDEATGFRPVRLPDPNGLKQALGSKCRNFTPPVQLRIEDDIVDGERVVVAHVQECDPAHKPCRAADGRAYVRSWDGDYVASALEEQAFLRQRTQPTTDRDPIDGATIADLDVDLIRLWREGVGRDDPRGLGRFSGDEQLQRAAIVTPEGKPTLGGLLALGIQPQQFLPRLGLQLSVVPADGARARDAVFLTGPLPAILDGALEWARREFPREILSDPDGHVRDTFAYPLVAFRELVSNALVHRAFDPWARGFAAEVRLYAGRLVVTSPGGLYGITVDRLGRELVTTSRNASLVGIAQYTVSPETGGRVIEALSTGISTVFEECAKSNLPAPKFHDNGVRFTAIVLHSAQSSTPPDLTATELAVFEALVAGPRTAKEIAAVVGTGEPNARKALRGLNTAGLVIADGGRGKRTTYSRTRSSD